MKPLLILFLLLAAYAHAGIVQDFDAGSSSDSDMVHGLAHIQAGTYAAIPIQLLNEAPWTANTYARSWWWQCLTDAGGAALVTMLYETETYKGTVPFWQHTGQGALGGLEVAGISISMRF